MHFVAVLFHSVFLNTLFPAWLVNPTTMTDDCILSYSKFLKFQWKYLQLFSNFVQMFMWDRFMFGFFHPHFWLIGLLSNKTYVTTTTIYLSIHHSSTKCSYLIKIQSWTKFLKLFTTISINLYLLKCGSTNKYVIKIFDCTIVPC